MKNKDNFVDYVFTINDDITWTLNESGDVIVDMVNKGFTNLVAQKFFGKPKVSHITLEGIGSFVFTCIDGKRSVYEIGQMVKEKYQEEAEPLYERVSVYMKQLEDLGFISKR
jgi:hypothetical protein